MDHLLDVVNPGTGKVIERVPLRTEKELAEMVRAAVKAQESWSGMPIYERAAILYRFADLIDRENETLSALIATESGKPVSQARIETEDGANILRGNAERGKHLCGEVFPATGPGLEADIVFTRREPVGVVCCIVPFNFPMEISFHKISPALIMGNSVLLKAPSVAPLAILRLGELAKEAGLPKNVLQIFACGRQPMRNGLLADPAVRVVSMTGSTESGVELMRTCAPTMKRMLLELGGNDPFLIFEDADIDEAVLEMLTRFHNNGQICCAPKRFFVHRGIHDALVEKLLRACSALPRGDALDEGAEVTCLVSQAAADAVKAQIDLCVKQGASIACGGGQADARIEPTVLVNVAAGMDVAKNLEIFGPVIPIIPFDTESEAISLANASDYGLSAAILTKDAVRAFRVASRLDAGTVVQNGSCVYRHLNQPFGGVKMSGSGREGVGVSPEMFSQIKTHVIKGALAE